MSEKRFVIHDSSVEEYVESLENKNTQGKTKRDVKLLNDFLRGEKKGRARVVSNYSRGPRQISSRIYSLCTSDVKMEENSDKPTLFHKFWILFELFRFLRSCFLSVIVV